MSEIRNDDQLVIALLEAQPQPVFWLKPLRSKDNTQIIDFEYCYCNEEMLQFTGLTKEQILGRSLSTSLIMNADLREKIFKHLKTAFETGKKVQDTIFNQRINKYYSFLMTKVNDGVMSILQDRNQEYRMIREMEQQKTLLDNILKYSSSGISVTEVLRNEKGLVVDARTIVANDAAIRYTGIPKELYLSKTASEIDPAVLTSPLYQKAVETLATGTPFHVQYFIEPTGRWLELSVSKMDDDHLINVFTDITPTKEAQLQIEQLAGSLQQFIDTTQSAMSLFKPVLDHSGNVVDFSFGITNKAFAMYAGQTPKTVAGDAVSKWYPTYLTNGLFNQYKRTYTTGETIRAETHYFGDGVDAWLDIMSTKMEDGVLITITDHTSLRKLQLQMERIIEELKHSNANLEEFAYAASHDLQEPLRKINFFAERLRHSLNEKMSESERGMFERMEAATIRMRTLIDDLLAYSQLTTKPKILTPVNLNEIVQQVLQDLEATITEKAATIETDELPIINGDALQLRQLFQNLLSNALKYSKEDVAPVISVQASIMMESESSPPRQYHQLEIKDNGIGFEQENAERIFKVFQRLHGRSEYPGTGVGLAIVQKVVQNHDGWIRAESQVGRGSIFRVALPVLPRV